MSQSRVLNRIMDIISNPEIVMWKILFHQILRFSVSNCKKLPTTVSHFSKHSDETFQVVWHFQQPSSLKRTFFVVPSMNRQQFRIAKVPNNNLALDNCVYLNQKDFAQLQLKQDDFIIIDDVLVHRVRLVWFCSQFLVKT